MDYLKTSDDATDKGIASFWKRPDYRGFFLLQTGLFLTGVQSLDKTAEILNVDQESLREVLHKLAEIKF